MKTKKQSDFEMAFFEGIIKKNPDYVEALIPLAEAYTRNGLYEAGLKIDRRLSRICTQDPVVHYNLGCSLALVGKKTEALKALRKAIRLGYSDFTHMRKDRDLKSLHGNSHFERLFTSGRRPAGRG